MLRGVSVGFVGRGLREGRWKMGREIHTCVVYFTLKQNTGDFVVDEARGVICVVGL
jgi:hypothetical protein